MIYIQYPPSSIRRLGRNSGTSAMMTGALSHLWRAEENHDILQEACGTISLRTVQRVAETEPLAHLARMLG